MKKFIYVVMSLEAHATQGIDSIEVITGDNEEIIEDVLKRTLIDWGEGDFQEILVVDPSKRDELHKDPELFYEENAPGAGCDISVWRSVDVTDADVTDEDFRKEESLDRRR